MTPPKPKPTAHSEAQLLRHDINNALYAFNAAFNNLLGKKLNTEEAKALYSLGVERLKTILARAGEDAGKSTTESKPAVPTAESSQQSP